VRPAALAATPTLITSTPTGEQAAGLQLACALGAASAVAGPRRLSLQLCLHSPHHLQDGPPAACPDPHRLPLLPLPRAARSDYDLYPPYSPKLKCPKGWYAARDSDKQRVKDLLDDAFYRMVLPAINLDHSKRARQFQCQPADVVSLHHHHVAGCLEHGTVRGRAGGRVGNAVGVGVGNICTAYLKQATLCRSWCCMRV